MQVYKPVNVQSFLDELLSSQKSKNEKLKTFSTLFVTLYANLVFQTIVNIENSILPGNWTLTNLSLSDSGLITIDFQDFHVVTREITISQQADIIKSSSQHFFKQIHDFCQTSRFHYEKMNTILITLHKWNENMCHNFQSGTLYKTWQAPMFTPTLLEFVAHRHRLHRHRHHNPSTSSASCHPKPGTRCPTYFWVVLLCLTPKQLQKILTIATFGDCAAFTKSINN